MILITPTMQMDGKLIIKYVISIKYIYKHLMYVMLTYKHKSKKVNKGFSFLCT